MSYSATVRRLLISCPGDVPKTDMAIVHKAINRWNGIYGQGFATAVIPISWGAHATAEFGRHPQEILNEQLVDYCDVCIAIFAKRLGTRTAVAESGTAEEIDRLHEAGRYVAVLQSRRPVDITKVDLDQAKWLRDYLAGLQGRALILDYATDVELENHVDAILTAAVSRDGARAELQIQSETDTVDSSSATSGYAEVWPRVESSERIITNSKGKVRTTRSWYLVLENTGRAAAQDVRFSLEAINDSDETWSVHRDTNDDAPDVEMLAPRGNSRFPILASMGSAPQARCVVTWVDERGQQKNMASLRLT